MAKPEYKLSTPNTGSYQLAPQAAPVSTYVRPKQLDPNLTDYKTQAATFQNFVESMTEWRVAENKDNQEKAQLRALADNALGELDANLEGEDDDYREFGMYLQGKNYAQEVGSKLVTEITVGSEGQMGIMDRAFAEAKLPKNHNRKVADIFSEMLEERKDYYRDQVPDSSDAFYSGFGEALQPYATEINKAFYEKVQEETYSDRRENFAQGFRGDVEQAVTFLNDPNVSDSEKENFKKQNKFDHKYLRKLSEEYGSIAGLSEDAALGESLRIWSTEIEELILNADSGEELEVAQEMLAVFITTNKKGLKLVDIPTFKKEARNNYVSLTNAINQKEKLIEAKEKEEDTKKRDDQEINVIASLVKGKNLGDLETFRTNYPNLKPEDYYQLLKLENSIKDRGKKDAKVVTDPIVFGDALIASKNGSLTRAKALKLYTLDKKITKEDYKTLIGNIESSTKISKPVRDYIEGRLIDVELDKLPRIFRGKDGLSILETARPDDYKSFKKSLLELKLKIYDKTDKHLKDNQLELNIENQIQIMDDVLKDLEPDIQKHNNFVKKLFSEETPEEKQPQEEKREPLELIGRSGDGGFSFELTPQHQDIYMGDQGHQALYEDYYAYLKKIKGSKSARVPPQNIFSKSGIKGREHVDMFIAIQKKLERPADEFRNWMSQRLLIDSRAAFLVDSLETTYRELWKIFGEGQFPRDRKSTSGVLDELSEESGGA